MTIREKLDLLAKSEDRNAAMIEAFEIGIVMGIASVIYVMDVNEADAIMITTAASIQAKANAYDTVYEDDEP